MSDNPESEIDRLDVDESSVEQPSDTENQSTGRGSLVALFLVPLAIVSAFAMVTVLFSWLAFADEQPEDLVRDLQRVDRQSWRKAVQLVQLLREQENDAIRLDAALARQLASILDEEIAAGDMSDERVRLRSFLCRALGEFHVPGVLPPLILAAKTERDASEIDVRRSAFEAIAIWWPQQSSIDAKQQLEVFQIATQATERLVDSPPPSEARNALRATAAFTLGVLGGVAAESRLVELQQDPSRDVRYNAATGLARHGRVEAEDVLLEMLDSAELSTGELEKDLRHASWTREIVLRNALQSIQNLAAKKTELDTRRMATAVQRLRKSEKSPPILDLANRTLQALNASQ